MYPLRFQPLFRRYLWGGTRLANQLGKDLGENEECAESWEIVDHGDDQSVVMFGSLKGQTLHNLIEDCGIELLGQSVLQKISDPRRPDALLNRFPLLFKFLDANRTLSVQVHPNDELAMLNEPADLGKTEAWYVVDAEPGALIYAGLKPGVDSDQLMMAAEVGETESVLHSFEAKTGDCVFIPAGTIHAIGEGLLIAEIQQSSDTTYRLFDWNRVDKDGNPRELHVNEAIHCTNYAQGPVQPQKVNSESETLAELVSCKEFTMHLRQVEKDFRVMTGDRFVILAVVDGEVELDDDPSGLPLTIGQTALVPACMSSLMVRCKQAATVLEISML